MSGHIPFIKMRIIFSTLVFIIILYDSTNSQNLLLGNINEGLGKKGVNLEIAYTGEYFSNIVGGIEQNSDLLHNFDLIFDFDLDNIFGWKNASVNTYILGNSGGIPNDFVGTIQGISNIAAYNTWKIYEFWLEQNLFNEKLSLLLGLYDLNSEFDVQETSSIFLNPSHGIGPEIALTGLNGPSIFPTTSLALRAIINISDNLLLKTAIFDGVPGDVNNPNGTKILLNKKDGILSISELQYHSNSEIFAEGFFKYSLGAWFYTEKFENFESSFLLNGEIKKSGNFGVYASGEKKIISENNNVRQGLSAFLRIGFANKNVNQISSYYGGGINYIGLFPGRDNEILGLVFAVSNNSSKFMSSVIEEYQFVIDNEHEYIFEFTYTLNIFDYLIVQPDLQYVINPVFSSISHSLLFGIRINLML